MNITTRAGKMLKEKLAQIYMDAAGLNMIDISPEAMKTLKEELIKRCLEARIGFRILAAGDECGKTAFVIKFDKLREGDAILEVDGIKVFVDPASITSAAGHELDYIDGPEGSFVLR